MKRYNMYIIEKDGDYDYILELWGGSTHHCDVLFRFSDEGFVKVPELSKETQLFQWVLYCASRLYLSSHARNLVEWAMTQYDTWMQSAGTRLDLEVKSW